MKVFSFAAAVAAATLTTLFAVAPAAHAAPAPAPVAQPDVTQAGDIASAARPARVRGPATRYCYEMETTGSLIVTRSCRTREQWRDVGVIIPANL